MRRPWKSFGSHSGAFTAEQAKAFKDEIVSRYGEEGWNAPGDAFLAMPKNIAVDMDRIWEETELLSVAQRDAMKKLYVGPVGRELL